MPGGLLGRTCTLGVKNVNPIRKNVGKMFPRFHRCGAKALPDCFGRNILPCFAPNFVKVPGCPDYNPGYSRVTPPNYTPITFGAGQTSTRLRSGGAAADPYSIMTRTDHNWDQSRLCSFTQVIFYLGQRHYDWTNRRSRNFPFGFFTLK